MKKSERHRKIQQLEIAWKNSKKSRENNSRKSRQTNDYLTAIILKCSVLLLNSKKRNKMLETRKLPRKMEL